VNEQPFTRSLDAVALPADIDPVIVRAHDARRGHGGVTVRQPPVPHAR
jgi:hypothetical protein